MCGGFAREFWGRPSRHSSPGDDLIDSLDESEVRERASFLDSYDAVLTDWLDGVASGWVGASLSRARASRWGPRPRRRAQGGPAPWASGSRARAICETTVRHEEGFIERTSGLRLYWQRWTPDSPPRGVVVCVYVAVRRPQSRLWFGLATGRTHEAALLGRHIPEHCGAMAQAEQAPAIRAEPHGHQAPLPPEVPDELAITDPPQLDVPG